MNNRQSGGRRRGRGGQQQRSQGNPGRPDNGNRIDNRARGNAAQLLEKYKTLARDAQMAGDRVNTEYYLQFADHYFRVLSESRARFEEQNPNHQPQKPIRGATLDEDDFAEDGEETPVRDDRGQERMGEDRGQERREERSSRDDRGNRDDRGPREERQPRGERQPRREERMEHRVEAGADDAPAAQGEAGIEGEPMTAEATPVADKPRRRRTRREEPAAERRPEAEAAGDAETAGFDATLLPPSISLPQGLEGEPVEIKPRRRRARPAASEDVAAAE